MSTRSLLEEFLRDRLASVPVEAWPTCSKLSRRAFLGSLGASSLVAAHSVVPRNVVFSLRRTRGGFSLSYAGQHWTIDQSMFGRKASVSLLRTAGGHTIRLARATMPGTSVPVSFEISLFQRRTWRINISIPGLRIAAEMDLADWMRGKPAQSGSLSSRYRAGQGTLTVERGRATLSSDGGLAVNFSGKVALNGRAQCDGRGLTLRTARRNAVFHTGFEQMDWVSQFEVDTPKVSSRALSCGSGADLTLLRIDKANNVSGEFFDTPAGSDEAFLIDGPARLELRRRNFDGAPLQFNRAFTALHRDRIGIAGTISSVPAYIRSKHVAVRYRGEDATPFSAVFAANSPAHFEALVRTSEIRLPMAGGEAQIALPDQPMVLSTRPLARQIDELIVVDDHPAIVTKLDKAVIRVRSPENLLDLKFSFEGFELSWGELGAPLLERTKSGGYFVDGSMVVEFPPQHLTETIQDPQGQPGCIDADATTAARLSGPSRVAFTFPRNPSSLAIWKSQPLTIDNLTNWAGLEMKVDPRANSVIGDADIDAQIKAAGITKNDSVATALAAIGRTIVMPKPSETALELVDKLVFSPSEKAVWERSELPSGGSTPIFGMRIGNAGNASVAATTRLRALYSRRIPGLSGSIPKEADLSTADEPDAPLTAKEHWEIIGQTSVYGLPAFRRISDEKTKEAIEKAPGDPNLIVTKVARSGVVRPDGFTYLKEIDTALSKGAPETGIALASVFQTADVTLTSLGATMRVEWSGQPPLLRSRDNTVPKSFSLERLLYQTWLGRDVRVIAVHKGYLFPFGIPASFIIVAERVFLRGPLGKPIAKEVRRRFITTSSDSKRFPAVNQPDDGLDFPVSKLTMQTTKTPDLVAPDDAAGGLVPGFKPKTVFWPRIKVSATEVVDFDWKCIIDSDVTPLVNRMLFVDQTMTGEDDVKKIVEYYNGTIATSDPGRRATWPAHNVARLGGARRTYAARRETAPSMPGSPGELPPVDTAYDTDSWLLIARGRSSDGDDSENFVMDARMNGADQPPFYPSIRRAAISAQSIDRLVGRPQGVIETRLYQPYVSSGFDPTHNKAEIFLEVMWPIIKLDVADEGHPATGGVAQPKTLVAALSRINGVVGGKSGGTITTLAPRNDADATLDFSSAARGEFDPSEFFSPKVFGIDILSGLQSLSKEFGRAPRLSELVEQGVGKDRAEAIRASATAARAEVGKLRKNIDAAVEQFRLNLHNGITFQQLYPELNAAYVALMTGLDAQLAIVASPNSDLADATTAAVRVSALAKPFFSEVGRIARDPVPPLVNDLINQIIGYWEDFAKLIGELPNSIAAKLQALVRQELARLTALGADQLALLLGLDSGETVLDLATKPEARARLGETLLFEQIGVPIVRLLDTAEQLLVELSGTILLDWTELHDAAEDAIHQTIRSLAGVLVDDPRDSAPNILREEQIEALSAALADAALAKIRAVTTSADLDTAIATLQRISGDLASGQATFLAISGALDAEMRLHRAWFRADDPQIALDRFAAAVTSALMTTVVAALTRKIAEVLPVVRALEQKALDVVVDLALKALQTALDGADALERLAVVASNRTTSWCMNVVDGVLGVVKAIGDQVLASQPMIETWIAQIGTEIAQVQLPASVPAPVVQQFNTIKTDFGGAVAAALAAAQRLGTARARLSQMTSADTCAATTAFAKSLADCIAERGRMIRAMRGVVLQIRALDRLTNTSPGDFKTAVAVHLGQIISLAKNLVAGVTLAGNAGQPGIWHDTVAKAKDRLLNDIAVDDFKTDLQASYAALIVQGTAIRTALVNATPDLLIDLTEQAILLADPDRRFAGLIVETVALADDARGKIEDVATKLIKGAAGSLRVLHETGLQPLLTVQQLGNRQPVVAYLLAGFADFNTIVADVQADIKRLKAIENAPDFASLVAATGALQKAWKGQRIPLLRAVSGLGAFVDAILKGKFSELVGDTIRNLMKQLEEELRDLIKQFVPTKIQTRYDWNTKIGDVDAGLLAFKMDVPADTNLTIASSIDFDFLSGQRTASITGKLEPFSLAIDGSGTFFTLHFDGASFASLNGASPTFSASFKNVELGPALTFLQQLQELLGSSGNGLYALPQLDRIRVGYGFSRDQVNVGPLIVSNVALDVYAELPFGGESPEFGFLFASAARPFLISYPPYGGGGWVSVISHPGNVGTGRHFDIGISLMFGAVAPINFGPLQGQGRICAGIEFMGDKISSFVQAVGEGNIACFSISIYIGIFLTHDNATGSLDGEAILEFKFKVSFCTFKYKVVAHRHFAGPTHRDPPRPATAIAMLEAGFQRVTYFADEALRAVGVPPAQHKHESIVPSKSHAWTRYRRYVSLELLRD